MYLQIMIDKNYQNCSAMLYGSTNASTWTADSKNSDDQQQRGQEMSRKEHMKMYMHQHRSARIKYKETDLSHKLEVMQAETSMQNEKLQNEKYDYLTEPPKTVYQNKLLMISN